MARVRREPATCSEFVFNSTKAREPVCPASLSRIDRADKTGKETAESLQLLPGEGREDAFLHRSDLGATGVQCLAADLGHVKLEHIRMPWMRPPRDQPLLLHAFKQNHDGLRTHKAGPRQRRRRDALFLFKFRQRNVLRKRESHWLERRGLGLEQRLFSALEKHADASLVRSNFFALFHIQGFISRAQVSETAQAHHDRGGSGRHRGRCPALPPTQDPTAGSQPLQVAEHRSYRAIAATRRCRSARARLRRSGFPAAYPPPAVAPPARERRRLGRSSRGY